MGFFDFVFPRNSNKPEESSTMFEESASELSPDKSRVQNLYSPNGIKVDSVPKALKISYNGLLAQNGAQEINVLVGYGSVDKWNNVSSYSMKNVGNNTFESVIPVCNNSTLNLAFNDNCNNWDNNLGQNYSFFF